MKPPQTRLFAENSFVREGKNLAEIAGQVGVSERTLDRWSKDGEWLKKRQEFQHESPQAALDMLKSAREMQIKKMRDNKRVTPKAIDTLHKLTALIEKMESRIEAIGPMLDTLERFAQFVGANADDEACAVLCEWTEKFLDEERGKCR
jgi:transposase